MQKRAARFRTAVADHNAKRGASRREFTEDLREEALRYLSDRRSEGATYREITKELGLGQSTLEKWRRQASAFRRVRRARGAVRPGSPQRAEPAHGGLSVRTVSGLHIEGLDLSDVIELVRAVQ